MMTSVVAAGNGGLSNGFYRGIAPEANVVLVKLAEPANHRAKYSGRSGMDFGEPREI
jgi:hypothetical protein